MPKIFCLGLHKTGTSSLYDMAIKSKIRSTHSTNWDGNTSKLLRFNFFSDGGSHYDNLNEFNYKKLFRDYPRAKFIINIRDLRSWIISKLIHAGWNSNTVLVETPDNYTPKHQDWKVKSLRNISLFITHYINWYTKLISFFLNKPNKAIIINICQQDPTQLNRLKLLFNNRSLTFSHKNKVNNKITLSDHALSHIDHEILVVNKEKLATLQRLIQDFK